MATTGRLFAADTRCAEGHFPGNPIIPGAVLLSETLRAIAAQTGATLLPGEIKAAKFLYPVRPGERVTIDYAAAKSGELKFTCIVDDKTVMTGIVACEPPTIMT